MKFHAELLPDPSRLVPIFASVFIAMLVMFIFEDMRSSNILKRTGLEEEEEEIEEDQQESLDEFENQ